MRVPGRATKAARPAWRRATVVLVTTAPCLVVVGCTAGTADGQPTSRPSTAQTPSEVRWGSGDDTEFGVRVNVAEPGRPWSEGGFVLCVTGTAPAEVTGVRFAKGSGVNIRRYAVRQVDPDRSSYLGSQPGTLTSLRFVPATGPTTQVTDRCDDKGPFSELGFEAALAPGRQAGGVSDLRVQYRSLSRRGEVSIPFELQMCQRDASESFCH